MQKNVTLISGFKRGIPQNAIGEVVDKLVSLGCRVRIPDDDDFCAETNHDLVERAPRQDSFSGSDLLIVMGGDGFDHRSVETVVGTEYSHTRH